MKKRILFLLLNFIIVLELSAQTIEKLGKKEEIKYYSKLVSESPFGIYVDEINDYFEIMNGNWDGSTKFSLQNLKDIQKKDDVTSFWCEVDYRFGEYIIGCSNSIITIQKNRNIFLVQKNVQSGISFILKKGNGYIVYYIDKYGYPGAVDTEGKIYTNKEAIAYLKQYDSEKYTESLLRAEELGLKNAFENAEVLVWGKRYYNQIEGGSLYQYDIQGNRYGIRFFWWGNYKNDWGTFCEVGTEDTSNFICLNVNEEKFIFDSTLNNYSKILGSKGDYQETRPDYSTSWYVGFGGNIYYYIAGEEYTEVFRIRRTWGAPDFYAMAINGYTEDEYGKYVDEVLPKLSKEELRLLRNTIFALYGVHFKSEDLNKYFDKQVWYTDEGKASGEIELPSHRQKLVEMIKKLEK